jgi:anti-anti-sigma regulatory factor/ligand-binding sensor protein
MKHNDQIGLTALIDTGVLQQVADNFSKAFGLAAGIFDMEGCDIVMSGKMSPLCLMAQSTEGGTQACLASDVHMAADMQRERKPLLRVCDGYARLIDVAVPISVAGEVVAWFGTGQFLTAPPDLSDEKYQGQAELMGVSMEELKSAYAEVKIMDWEQAEGAANLIYLTVNAVAEQAYRQLEQERRSDKLARTIEELSTPVIQVWDGVLVLPLVGSVDTRRAQMIMETLLTGITRQEAEVVIIDVTGVPIMDTKVADHLLQTVRAAKLLGTECVLTGISPEMAGTVVSLGLDLSGITTQGNLQNGIKYALSRLDQKIVDKKKL